MSARIFFTENMSRSVLHTHVSRTTDANTKVPTSRELAVYSSVKHGPEMGPPKKQSEYSGLLTPPYETLSELFKSVSGFMYVSCECNLVLVTTHIVGR